MDGRPEDGLEMWTIYDHPRDFPEHFVVRRSVAYGGRIVLDQTSCLCDSLDQARASLPRPDLVCLERHPQDDPVIVEVWL